MVIKTVFPNSIASSIGLKSGDRLLKINNRKVLDEIDYQFRFSSDFITISVEMNGALESFEIEKEYDDLLGVVFEDMKIRSCANDCVFCFVDQNPSNMRKGMYFRDGDYRLSYLHGHYITMTNMGQRELNRVVEQKLSPLYISIHVTDKDLRKKLFLYKGRGGEHDASLYNDRLKKYVGTSKKWKIIKNGIVNKKLKKNIFEKFKNKMQRPRQKLIYLRSIKNL